MFFDSVYPTRPSDTVTKYIQFTPYLIGGKIIQIVLGLILLLYPIASKTWLKIVLHCTFWNRISGRVRFYKSSFFMPSFRHQDSNSYYLVVATAKIPKLWKQTSLDVYFSRCKSQDRAINCQWIIQPKLIHWNLSIHFNFSWVIEIAKNASEN